MKTGLLADLTKLLLTMSLVLAVPIGVTAAAEDDLPPHATLKDLLDFSESNNSAAMDAHEQWRAAGERISQSKALPDPRFEYDIEPMDDPSMQRFWLKQMYPGFGKRSLQGRVAIARAESDRLRWEAQKLQVRSELKTAWFEYWYLARSIALTQDSVSYLRKIEQVAQARQQSGAPIASVLQTQVELGQQENTLSSLQDMRAPAAARINAALGRTPDATLPWPPVFETQTFSLGTNDAEQLMLKQNPELAMLDAMSREQAELRSLARKRSLPDFELGVRYTEADDPAVNGDVMGMVGLSIPLWQSSYRAGVREAEAGQQAVQARRDNLVRTLLAQLRSTLYGVYDAERRITLYQDTLIPRAQEALQAALDSFESGLLDFASVLDAERTLLELQLNHERARADREEQVAHVEALTATPVPTTALAPAQQEVIP
ncbi:MAG TPA: TolC family protein [Kiritimatiellia bacterium]|nr:TolC family protein [Kiritimatiellia bacterium]